MPKLNSYGFVLPLPLILGVIILSAGFITYKSLPINQPQPTPDKGFEGSSSAYLKSNSPAPSPSNKVNITKKVTTTPTPQASSTSTQSSSSNTSSSSSSSSNSQNNNSNSSTSSSSSQSNNSSATVTTPPTPAPSPSSSSSCSSLCFDRGSATIEVVEGQDVQNGGLTAFAFKLIGDGSHGYLISTTGLPAGLALTPVSGGFANGDTLEVRAWINTNNAVSYGTYNGTVTLKKGNGGGSYSEVGTMNITVTYKKP